MLTSRRAHDSSATQLWLLLLRRRWRWRLFDRTCRISGTTRRTARSKSLLQTLSRLEPRRNLLSVPLLETSGRSRCASRIRQTDRAGILTKAVRGVERSLLLRPRGTLGCSTVARRTRFISPRPRLVQSCESRLQFVKLAAVARSSGTSRPRTAARSSRAWST